MASQLAEDPYDISKITIKFDNLKVDTLRQLLFYRESVEVTFIKANGEVRVMNATLHPGVLPQDQVPTESTRKKSETSVAAWDLDKKAWRTIVADKVTQLKYTTTEGEDITLQKGVIVGK